MKQGSTWPIRIDIAGVDLSQADWVIVSVKQRMQPAMELNQDQVEIEPYDGGTQITLSLSEAQSLELRPGNVKIDVNWSLYGIRDGAEPRILGVSGTLLTRAVGI